MFYRIHQFIRTIMPRIKPADVEWATNHLSLAASELFLSQSKAEQRHAIDVAKSILKASYPLSYLDYQNLISAALLHDCGKSVVSIRLWQRVYIVLMHKAPKPLWSILEKGPSLFSFPLKIYTRHSLWSEYLARKSGMNSIVCHLIREHHSPNTDLGRILQQADNAH